MRRGGRGSPRLRRVGNKGAPHLNKQDSPIRRILRGPVLYILVVLAALWLFLSLGEYEQLVAAGQVRTATFLEGDQKVVGELAAGGVLYAASYPAEYQDDLTQKLLAAPGQVEVRTDAQRGSLLVGLLVNVIPILLIVGILFFTIISVLEAIVLRGRTAPDGA